MKKPDKDQIDILLKDLKLWDGTAKYQAKYNECLRKLDFLVIMFCRKYVSFDNYEDLLQDGRIALMKAIDTYKIGSSNFYYWSKRYISTRVARRANKHSTINISLKDSKNTRPIKVSMPNMRSSIDVHDDVSYMEHRDMLYNIVDTLPDPQKEAIGLKLRGGYTLSEISSTMKLSKNECSRLIASAETNICNRMREHII